MEGVYKELDELKAELEKLKEEYRIKTELSESLRRAHSDQLAKSHEAKLQIEKQAKELNDKSEELVESRQLYEEVKSKMHELESSLKQVSFVNDKIRIDTGEKVLKLEGENKKLTSALEEATGTNDDLGRKLCACNKEIEGLKNLLSDSQRKCLEAEEKARAGRELRHREEVISKLEEESMSIQDQLKWKKEQFEHLEEAHKRLQDLFQSSKEEWESEKSDMLEELTALQFKLDSQLRITESLESRLKMCNQALAQEENRRKTLEVQLSESKQCFENVLAEYEEAKEKIESLSTKRDEDIADLRNSLGMKEILSKEMEYRVTHLELENKELLGSLKELQEAQINKRKPDPSLSKLRNKLKHLEQVHSNCSLALEESEAEWNSKMEKLLGHMKCYESDLKRQSEQVDQLKMQLDNCHSAMEVSGEEISILLLMMKSELCDAYSKLFKSEDQIEAFNKERGEKNAVSAQRLEMRHCSPLKAHAKQAHEDIALMTQKLESMKLLEERGTFLESALTEHKKMLKESSDCQLRLKEQVSEMEVALKKLSNALEKSNSELAAKITEATQTDMELQSWKFKAESFRTCLEQSREVCKQMEKSLLEQIETVQSLRKENVYFRCKTKEQENEIKDLQQKISSLDLKLMQKEEATEAMKMEVVEARKKGEHYVEILKEKDATVENLRKNIAAMEEQSMLEIKDLQQKINSLDEKFMQKEEATEAMKMEVVEARKKGEHYVEILKEKDATVENLRKNIEAMEEQSMLEIKDLQQKINSLDQKLMQKEAATEGMKLEVVKEHKKSEHFDKILKEKDATLENLQKEIKAMEEQSMNRELTAAESARVEAETKFKLENEELCRTIITEKDEQIRCIKDFASSLERDFMEVALFSFSRGIEDTVKIVAIQDALKKSEFHMNTEIERRNSTIDILKKEVSNLHGRMLLQEESLLQSKQSVKELEAQIEFRKLDAENLLNQLSEEQTKLKEVVKGFEQEKAGATSSIKSLSFERDNLLAYIEGICEQFGDFCTEDVKLQGMLGKILHNSDKDDIYSSDDIISDRFSDLLHMDVKNKVGATHDRSPLREINK